MKADDAPGGHDGDAGELRGERGTFEHHGRSASISGVSGMALISG